MNENSDKENHDTQRPDDIQPDTLETIPQDACPVVLYSAQDAQGRLYLTDDPAYLPADAHEAAEWRVAPGRVEWALLQVQVQELRGALVTLYVGDCRYATDAPVIAAPFPDGKAADPTTP